MSTAYPSMTVPSSDGVEVVVHDFGGTGRTLLLSHATGFHAHCYVPIATALAGRFHSYGLDYRGHGMTAAPVGVDVDWVGYGDDAVAVADSLGEGLIGFGHSMGGACLLMAAHRHPGLFEKLIVFEPIVFPPVTPEAGASGSPLASGARRRRAEFASFDEAYANYARKPPLMNFHPDALRAYVDHGFVAVDGGVRLRCEPEHEARTFETGGLHRTWDVLGEIATPVVVIAGAVTEMSPSAIAEPISAALPAATYIGLDHLDHFGPMTHPDEIAGLIAAAVDG